MKKIKLFAFAALTSFMFVACNAVDSTLDNLEDACKEKEYEDVLEYRDEFEAYNPAEVTRAQQIRYNQLEDDYGKVISDAEEAAEKK